MTELEDSLVEISRTSMAALDELWTPNAGGDQVSLIDTIEDQSGPDSSLHLRPAEAVRKLLERTGLAPADIDLWEINEAFAGVTLASARDLELALERVNVNGGAVALGHPLAASGFRLVLTLAYELRRRGGELGVAAICGGGGQGEAILLRSLATAD